MAVSDHGNHHRQGNDLLLADVTGTDPCENGMRKGAPSQGVSILKEIFPDSCPNSDGLASTGNKALSLPQLGRLPTPARSLASSAPLPAPPAPPVPRAPP